MSEETNQEVQGGKRSGLVWVIGIVVVIAVVAVLGYFVMNNKSINLIQPAAVALVNGQKITRSEYDDVYARLVASIELQGQSATTTEMQSAIKKQTLDNLISETLILQSATKEGIKADEIAINAQFSQSKSQFPDTIAFEKALTDQGLTEATFKDTLTKNNIIQQYLKAHIDASSATASEKEIETLYNQAKASDKSVPPLKEVKVQVESQIIQQKQQLLISNFIERLKASSTIETLI